MAEDKYLKNRQLAYDLLKKEGYTDIGDSAEKLFEKRSNGELAFKLLKEAGYTDLGDDYVALFYGDEGEKTPPAPPVDDVPDSFDDEPNLDAITDRKARKRAEKEQKRLDKEAEAARLEAEAAERKAREDASRRALRGQAAEGMAMFGEMRAKMAEKKAGGATSRISDAPQSAKEAMARSAAAASARTTAPAVVKEEPENPYADIISEKEALDRDVETYNSTGKGNYSSLVERERALRGKIDGMKSSPEWKEYLDLSDRYGTLSAVSEETPEIRLEKSRLAAELSRNPVARAMMGSEAPGESQIEFDTNRAEAEYIESQMEGADRAKKKEYKARLKELNREVLDNDYYQSDVARRIDESQRELDDLKSRMRELEREALKHNTPGNMTAGDAWLRSNLEYRNLTLAANERSQAIRRLEHIRDKNAGDFWVNFMDVFSDVNTYDFNITNLEKALATKIASKTPEADDGSQELLSAVATGNEVSAEEGKYVEGKGKYGQIAAQSIPFMLQIGLTGGFGGVAKAVEGRFAKAVGEKAADKFLVKATGAVLGDLTAGFVAANTIGAGKTATDILNNYFGTLVSDGEGGYKYEGGESLGRSVWGAEVGNTMEYASERAGEHMQHLLGRGILGWGIRQAGKGGNRGVNIAIEELAKSMDVTLKDFGFRSANQAGANWAQKAMGTFVKSLNRMGVQGLPFEVAEEYVGLLGNIILGGEEKWMDFSPFADKETHTDIWGGMLYSIGLTQAGTVALGGVGAAAAGIEKARRFHALENALESASAMAEELIGDEWRAIKDEVDGTENKDLPAKIAGWMDDPSYDPRQREAILEYVKDTYLYRGFNAGTIAQARERLTSEDGLVSLNVDAEAASAQDQISDAYMLGYQQSTAKRADVEQADLDRKSRRMAIDAIDQREEIAQAVERQKARLAEITGVAEMSEADASAIVADASQDAGVRDAALDYLMALAVERGFADAEENRQLRAKARIQASLEKRYGGPFYYENPMGDRVVETTKRVNPSTGQPENIFVLGEPNESGEVPFISPETGQRGFVSRDQVADVDEATGQVVPGLSSVTDLNTFLDEQYAYMESKREAGLAEEDAARTAEREASEAEAAEAQARADAEGFRSIVEGREAEDGSFTYNGVRGRLIRKMDDGAVFEPEDGSDNLALTWEQLANGSQETTGVPTVEAAADESVEETPAEGAEENAAGQEEEPVEETPKIPLDKNGNPVYDAPGVSVEDALESIYSTEGVSEEMADEYIIEEADKAEKARSPKRGKMSLAEWGRATAEANRKADFWAQLKEVAEENKRAREAEQKEEEERNALIEQYGVDPRGFDLTPQTLEEAVAEALSNGEHLINLDDAVRETIGRRKDGRVPTELFRHLGAHGILTKRGGQSIADFASDTLREFYGDLEHDEEQDAARQMVIDFLLSGTKSEIGRFIFDKRVEQAKAEAEEAESRKREEVNAWLRANTKGLSYGDIIEWKDGKSGKTRRGRIVGVDESTEGNILVKEYDSSATYTIPVPEQFRKDAEPTIFGQEGETGNEGNGEGVGEAPAEPGPQAPAGEETPAAPEAEGEKPEGQEENGGNNVGNVGNNGGNSVPLSEEGPAVPATPETPAAPAAPAAPASPAVPGNIGDVRDAAGARAFYEAKFGKGKKADKFTSLWEKTHPSKPSAGTATGETDAMARSLPEGLSEEDANDIKVEGVSLAVDLLEEDGLVKFGDFFRFMVENLGDNIRPFVKSIYMGAKPEVDKEVRKQMDSEDAVYDFDEDIDLNDIENEQGDDGVQPGDGSGTDTVDGGSEGEGGAEVPGETDGGPRTEGTDEAGGDEGGSGSVAGEGSGESGEGAEGQGGSSSTGKSGGRGQANGSRGAKRGSGSNRGGKRADGRPGGDVGRDTGRVEESEEEKQAKAQKAEQSAYEAEKERIKDETDTNKLKSLMESIKDKLTGLTDVFDVARAKLAGQLRAIQEKLRELFSSNIKKSEALAQEKIPYESVSDATGEHSVGAVVPSGSSDAQREAIKRVEKAVGKPIAQYVMEELGYGSLDEMFTGPGKDVGLSSEQVDAVGLAIYQMKTGKMLIVGDMTGMGKGRVGAALIRWGKKNGKKVLFVTEQPNLFTSMYDDIADIGGLYRVEGDTSPNDAVPWIVNDSSEANITSEDDNGAKTVLVPHPSAAEMDTLYGSDTDELPVCEGGRNRGRIKGRKYDFVMMTYSQGQAGTQEKEGDSQRVKDLNKRNTKARRKLRWIQQYAKDAVVIMDESHKASGNSARGGYFQSIAEAAQGVCFMSATFAKTPSNMVLYAIRSSMGEAAMTKEQIIDAIKGYGVPMQEILASALFKTGEMVRRERDFEGVKINWPQPEEIYSEDELENCRSLSDKTTDVIKAIIDFQRRYVNGVISKLNEPLKKRNEAELMSGKPDIYVSEYASVPYSGQVSNIIGMMLFAIKAKKAADMAIEQMKRGEKPVIAVDNTLGAYVDAIEGDIESADFGMVLRKGLAFAMRYQYTTKHLRWNEKEQAYKEVEGDRQVEKYDSIEGLLGETGVAEMEMLEQRITDYGRETLDLDLPLSPIDYIKRRIEAAGFKIGEITKRQNELVQNPDGTWTRRALKHDKKDVIRRFNGGKATRPLPESERLDCVIMNRSGATGNSMHASRRFGDQRPRKMIILQPAKDSSEEVQIRGRIDRTGQVSRGEYFYIMSPIPAEKKIIMMLRQKLASLDANSVGSEKVESNRVNAEDMDNKYGDEVARDFLADHPEINAQLDNPIKQKRDKAGNLVWVGRDGLLYDLLIGMQRMTCAEQELILSELEESYMQKIEYLNQNGINDLATSTMDLDAVTVDTGIMVKGRDNDSVSEFAHDTVIERVEVNVLRKQLHTADVHRKARELGGEDAEGKPVEGYGEKIQEGARAAVRQMLAEKARKQRDAEEALLADLRESVDKPESMTEEEFEKRLKEHADYLNLVAKNESDYASYESMLNQQLTHLRRATAALKPGWAYLVPLNESENAESRFGRFLGFKAGKDGRPKSVEAVFATKDSRAMVSIPIVTMAPVMKRIIDSSGGFLDPFGKTSSEYESDEARMKYYDERWDKMVSSVSSRQLRYMITGNILQACSTLGSHRGTIVTFTRKNPETGEITIDRGMFLAEDFDPENFVVRSKVTKEELWESSVEYTDGLHGISASRQGDKLVVKFFKPEGSKAPLKDHKILKDDEFKALCDDGRVVAYSREQLRAVVSEENVEAALEYLFQNYGFTQGKLLVMPDSADKVDRVVFTGKSSKDVLLELQPKHRGVSEYNVDDKIAEAVKEYKMDVGNEDLKTKIRELVQMRQAWLRERYTKEGDAELAWDVISYQQAADEKAKDVPGETPDQAIERKKERESYQHIADACKEELLFRGFEKGHLKHFSQGKVDFSEIEKTFEEFNSDEENAALAKRVFAIVRGLGLEVFMNEKLRDSEGGNTGGLVMNFNWHFMNEEFIPDQLKADTILHEAIHTVTAYAFRLIDMGAEHLLPQELADVTQELQSIYDAIRGSKHLFHQTGKYEWQGYNEYGTKNSREMMSETGANRGFRAALKKITLGISVKFGTVFLQDVSDQPNYSGKTENALSAVYSRLEKMLDMFDQHAYIEAYRGSRVGARDYVERGGALLRRSDNLRNPINRAEAISAAVDVAKKLGVTFREDPGLKAKGKFDPKTGEITVNVDEHSGTDDIVATILHEAVAHYGLRKLFGKEWKDVRSSLYDRATEGVRSRVDEIAEKYGLSREVAMEEYLAQLAEDGTFDAEEESFWRRVVTAVKRLLAKIGVNVPLNDADMRSLLYDSYRNLQRLGAVEKANVVATSKALWDIATRSHEGDGSPRDDGPGGGTPRRYSPSVPEVDQKPYDDELAELRSQELDVLRSKGRDSNEYKELKRKEGDVIRRYIEAIDPEHVPLEIVSVEGRDLEDFFERRGEETPQAEETARFVRMSRATGYYETDTRDITFFIEHVRDMERLRTSYVHERQHHLTNLGGADRRLASSVGDDVDILEKTLAKLTNVNTAKRYRTQYKGSATALANEIISFAMMRVFDSPTFASELENLQLADGIYDFLIDLADEQFNEAFRPAIQSRAYGSLADAGGYQDSEQDAGGEPGEVRGGGGGPTGAIGLPDDIRKDVGDLEIDQETEALYRRSAASATVGTAAQMYNARVRTVRSAIKEVLVDEYAPVDALMDALAKESGLDIKDSERVSDMLRETGGRAMYEIRQYEHKFLHPMWDAVGEFRKQAGSISIKETETYIGLKSGLERNVVLAKRDAKRDYQTQYDAEIEKINREEKEKKKALDAQLKSGDISDVTYQGSLAVLQQEMRDKRDGAAAAYDAHVAEVDAGTDAKFLEYRKKDYSAITAWAKTDDVADAERQAREYVDGLEAHAGSEATAELWKRINAATKETLRFQYEHQMLSRQQYSDISKMMEYYVPMRGFEEDTAEDLFSYYVTPQGSGFQATVLNAKGRRTWYEGPLGNIGAMHSSAIAQGVKNLARLSLLDAVRRRPKNTIATVTRAWFHKTGEKGADGKDIYEPVYPNIPEGATLAQREAIIAQFEQDMAAAKAMGDAYNSHREVDLRGGVVAFERESHKNEHMVTVREGGKEYAVIINGNPSAAQAINGVKRGNGAMGKLLGALRNWTRILSSMFTTYSIPFWVSNFQRDHGQGITNAFVRNKTDYVGKYILNRLRAAKLFRFILNEGSLDAAVAAGDPVALMYKQYVENGGPMGQNRVLDNEYFERQMKRYLKSSGRGGVVGASKAVLEAISGIGEAIETITRFATFMTSMEYGRPLHESISDAKEISTNFARKGSGRGFTKDELNRMRHANGKELTQIEKGFVSALAVAVEIFRATIPFFNAAVQGLENKVTNYREHTGKTLLADSIYFLFGLAMNLFLSNAGGDDDKEKYAHISDYVRRNNANTPLGNGMYAKWALPQEYRVMFALGDIMGSAIREERPREDLWIDAFGSVIQLSPIGAVTDEVVFNPRNKRDAYEILMTNAAPGVVAPVLESVFNRDFKGARLYNEGYNEDLMSYPGYRRALPTTGGEYVAASKFLNDISGGDDVKPGTLDKLFPNPAVVEHLVESYFSGPYQIVVRVPEAIAKGVKGELKVRDVPLLNRIILNTNDNQRDAFYSNMYYFFKNKDDEAERLHSEYKNRPRTGNVADFYDSVDYQYMLVFKKHEANEKAYRKLSKQYEEMGDMEKKKEYDAKLEEERYQIAKECLDVYFSR